MQGIRSACGLLVAAPRDGRRMLCGRCGFVEFALQNEDNAVVTGV